MNRELVVPNLHVILIHYLLGVFFLGLIIELLAVFWRRHSVRVAGRWMLLLGGLSMIPTATSGIYALHDVAVPTAGTDTAPENWREAMKVAPLNHEQWHLMRDHVLWGAVASGLIALTVVTFLGLSDRQRDRLYWPLLGVLVFGTVMMTASAWHAGEMVYRHGVAVDRPGTAEGEKTVRTEPAETTHQAEASPLYKQINAAFPPVQLHAIMAGLATAIALASVGVAFRRITAEHPDEPTDSAESLVKSLEPQSRPIHLRPGKLWLVAMLFFILTALGGWYVLGSDADEFVPRELWEMVVSNKRRLFHVIAAALTIVLPLVLAMLARWAPRQKLALAVLSLILLAVLGVQVWLGVLLLFDGPTGSVTRFN